MFVLSSLTLKSIAQAINSKEVTRRTQMQLLFFHEIDHKEKLNMMINHEQPLFRELQGATLPNDFLELSIVAIRSDMCKSNFSNF